MTKTAVRARKVTILFIVRSQETSSYNNGKCLVYTMSPEWRITVLWTAAASVGQWSRARRRFGFACKKVGTFESSLSQPEAKAPSPCRTIVTHRTTLNFVYGHAIQSATEGSCRTRDEGVPSPKTWSRRAPAAPGLSTSQLRPFDPSSQCLGVIRLRIDQEGQLDPLPV